jgi:hypothetical protein
MRAFCLVAVCLLASCDTRAQPAAQVPGAPAANPDRMSREHESCGTTAHCAAGLRCFEQTCRRVDRSVMGDYHAALAANLRDAGDLARSLAGYDDALRQYKEEGLTVPVDLECAYGVALADGRADKELAELAARVLHRCVEASPHGSALREAALRRIAVLDDSGLDASHLGRPEAADVYLSRAAAKPKSDALTVEVTASPELPASKVWQGIVDGIKDARPALVACWEANHAATRQPKLEVALPVLARKLYDDEPGTVELDKAVAPGDAERCVRDAIAPVLKAARPTAKWDGIVTVTVR